MRLLSLPDNSNRRLVFYLAMEEYAAHRLDSLLPGGAERDGLFFLWQSRPTVIFGRNQVMEAEVNLPYCREHGIETYRRKSGGGCVYSDEGNIMISCICRASSFTFDRFLSQLELALRRLGLDARRSGRNDVLVGGHKVSGNAFYLLPAAGVVHGTLLFSSDLMAMESAITPSRAKIESKGVSSVRSHVTNIDTELKAIGCEMSMDAFEEYLTTFFRTECEIMLDDAQVAEIEDIEKGYLDPAFINGRRHGYTLRRRGTVPGVGQVDVELVMDRERIDSCCLSGDFFPLREDVNEALSLRLAGCPESRDLAAKALEGLRLEEYIMNFTTSAFTELAFLQ